METTTKAPVNLTELSKEEKDQLFAQLAAEKENEKKTIAQQRTAYKDLVTETVPKVLFDLSLASAALQKAKTDAFKYFENILSLKNECYGVKDGQQSHTFSCDNGEITLGFRINEGWDDTAPVGIAKVEKYLESKATDADTAELVSAIFNLLKKDAKGNLKASRVLELKNYAEKSQNAEFIDGVDIILKAYKPVRSVWFLEASILSNNEKFPIPLNISSVDFEPGYTFDYMNSDPKGSIDGGSN